MAFADYDLDGDLDGLLVTNRFVSEADSKRLNDELARGRRFYVKRGNRVEILPDAQELMAIFRLTDPIRYLPWYYKLSYNDGYVAYLNGVEIAKRNAPASLVWNSVASASPCSPVGSLLVEELDILSQLAALQPGQLLACS